MNGGNWAARIKGEPSREGGASPDPTTTLFLYVGTEYGQVAVENEPDPVGFEGNVRLSGDSPGLGEFILDVTAGPETNRNPYYEHSSYEEKPLDRTLVTSLLLPVEHVWKAKSMSNNSCSCEDRFVTDFFFFFLHSYSVFPIEGSHRPLSREIRRQGPTASGGTVYNPPVRRLQRQCSPVAKGLQGGF